MQSPLAYAATETLRNCQWLKILDLCEDWAEVSLIISCVMKYTSEFMEYILSVDFVLGNRNKKTLKGA